MKNNRGFMLAEVVITSTVIITALVSLYTSFSKLYSQYNIRNSYFDIDGVYALNGMIDHLMDEEGTINTLFSNINDGSSTIIIGNNSCASEDDDYCYKLQELYKINNLIVVKFNGGAIDKINVKNKTFEDYLKYIKRYYNMSKSDDYDYLFIVEYNCDNKNKNCKYSSVGVS